MAKVIITVIALLIASAVCAPQNLPTLESSTLKSQKSTMTYEELEYVHRTKRSDLAVPPTKLSPCTRAILGCCQDKVMNSHCSELLSCGAFFFDDNPCEVEFVISALEAASTFYRQFEPARAD